MPQIEIKNLSFVYPGAENLLVKAIDGISVTIKKGEFVGLIGRTGSGKSTFVKHLNGLLKPCEGQVLLDGHDIWRDPSKIQEVRGRVGLVFQYPEHQLFEDTVSQDIAFGPANMGLSSKEIEKRVLDAIDFVGLQREIIDKSPFELSGGEKRKVAIAGVMAMDPEILVLDEPTAGLDPQGKKQLLARIDRYHRARGNTVILISHVMEDIAQYADRIMVLDRGKLVMFDSTKSVFACAERLAAMGLGVPQITAIMERIRGQFSEIDEGILTVDEAVENIMRVLKKRGVHAL